MGRNSSTSLAPGFRFHPTDEELVRYYLKRKVCGKPLRVDPITETDIYKSEPWELPEKSKMKTRDLEWYFFSALDKKFGNSSRTNRATDNGYWKTTGKDRPIRDGSRTVGMKKTLVYHSGRAPKGARSNWVMHEFRLEDEELVKVGIALDAFVLCRIFQKSGSGPKNGEQYGAPFIEEEWEDDVMAMVPGEEVLSEEAQYSEGLVEDGAFFDANNIELNFGVTPSSQYAAFPYNSYPAEDTSIYVDIAGNFTEHNPSEITPHPSNFYHGETSNCVEPTVDFSLGDLKPAILGETSELVNDQAYLEMPEEQYGMDLQPVKEEYFVQSSDNGNPMHASYSVLEQFLDATENTPFGEQVPQSNSNAPFGEQVLDVANNSAFDEGQFLETNDLSEPLPVGSPEFDVNDYLNFFDAGDDDSQYLAFDAAELMGTENAVAEQEPQMFGAAEAKVVSVGAQLTTETHNNTNEASSSNVKPEVTKTDTGFKNPFLKHASQMLESIPAPPAFAAEFPSKEAALRLNSTAQASSSVNVTAGMIRLRNMNLDVTGTDWSFGKNGNVDLVLSYHGSPQADDASTVVPTGDELSGKASSVVRRGWFLFMFFWVLFISATCKFGSYIYTEKCLGS